MLSAKQTGILLLLLVLTGVFSGFVSTTYQEKVEVELLARVGEALHADPMLQSVEPVFDGLTGMLDGIVAEPSLIKHAQEVAERAAPGVRFVENRISLASESPRLQAEFEGNSLVLRGEVSDVNIRDQLVKMAANLEHVEEVRDQLAVDAGVRRAEWMTSFVEFLPQFVGVATVGVAEATDGSWSLVGEVEGPKIRQDLIATWEKIVPGGADLKLADLKVKQSGAERTKKPSSGEQSHVGSEATVESQLADRLEQLTVYFPVNSSLMDELEEAKLVEVANVLHELKGRQELELVAFSDNQGDSEYNLWLSNKRAVRVRDSLQAKGVVIRSTRVEKSPIEQGSGNDRTIDQLQQQRRVELRLVK
tara:strand:- start:12870 stop:13958 length:1089 start_codon:yes stop_codon:yes gene_type:complete